MSDALLPAMYVCVGDANCLTITDGPGELCDDCQRLADDAERDARMELTS